MATRWNADSWEDVIAQKGCEGAFRNLEECLIQHDREMAKCQEQVNAFRSCFQNKQNSQDNDIEEMKKSTSSTK